MVMKGNADAVVDDSLGRLLILILSFPAVIDHNAISDDL
jgi:hypothetical protein